MKQNKLFIAIIVFFACCLFVIEPMFVMGYLDSEILKEYYFFTFFKFNTALLAYWLLYNWNIFQNDTLELSEKVKQKKKYTFILYVICFLYVLMLGLYILVI